MSILNYFHRSDNSLPSPRGQLSLSVPSAAIASANDEVRRLSAIRRTRGSYNVYTPEERALMGKFTVENGVMAAKRYFSKKFQKNINESTLRNMKKIYLEESSRKRRADDEDSVTELTVKKKGRKVLLGRRLDDMLQQYIIKLAEKGCVINTALVISAARGILKSQDRTRLSEYGGPVTLSKAWATSVLKRMKFTKRRGTTKSSLPPEEFQRVKTRFLQEIVDIVTMEEIPAELIFNWDQTGLNLVPVGSWTMALKGSKRVEIKGLEDKRQITAVFCGSLIGEFLPIQLVYAGKTDRCHPTYDFPSNWDITHSHNHWSNEMTMLRYINNVIVPFVDCTRANLRVGKEQAALAIFDHFRGQLTEQVTKLLESHNIQSVLVPSCCTDRLQPLDISVNKSAKSFLHSEFQQWYSDKVMQQLDISQDEDLENLEPIDLSAPTMKSVGAQWLVRLSEYLHNNPSIIVNGFLAANITQSIDAGKPVLQLEDESAISTEESESDTGTTTDDDSQSSSMCNETVYIPVNDESQPSTETIYIED